MRPEDEPVVRRLLFGILDREGLREGEALALEWGDLDLDRGVLRLDTNKTDDPRSWVMGEDVTRALTAWRELRADRRRRKARAPFLSPRARQRAGRSRSTSGGA